MNVLESYTLESPYGKSEECAKLDIFDTAEWFVFSDITTVGMEYTFSAWIRSDAVGSMTVGESYFTITTEWVRYKATFTADDIDLKLIFSTPGTYYFYHSQLELGNTATDWDPAPEDHDQAVSDATNQTNIDIKEQTDAVRDSCEAMVDDATKDLIPKSEFESYKEIVETRFKVETDGIDMEFYAVNDAIKGVNNELDDKFTELYKYITFDEHGITIGSGDSAITLQLDNSAGIIFRKNGKRFGLWDGTDFYTGNIVVRVEERAQLGNFAYVPRSDGSLSFLKVGD
jgi:hypothetical protein